MIIVAMMFIVVGAHEVWRPLGAIAIAIMMIAYGLRQ